MIIDNSAAKLFMGCPLAYFERYEQNLELSQRDTESLDFGTRWHDLQSGRFRKDIEVEKPLADARLEAECQATLAAYLQHYSDDHFDVVEVERTLVVPLNERHSLAFKIDLLHRTKEGLEVLDYKTEKRASQYNSPESWAARSQVSLYQWAASAFYQQPVRSICLDVTTRQSPKGQEPPLFQRQRLIRTKAQQEVAVANIIWVADQIEGMRQTGFWPSNTERCKDGWRKCDYYQIHVIGRTDGNLKLYQPAKPYLDL